MIFASMIESFLIYVTIIYLNFRILSDFRLFKMLFFELNVILICSNDFSMTSCKDIVSFLKISGNSKFQKIKMWTW